MIVVAIAAMNSQRNLLFWVLGVMVALLTVSLMVSGAMISGVRIRRLDPRHGTVGEALLVRYEVSNRNRFFSLFNIIIEEVPSREQTSFDQLMSPLRAWVMHVGPNDIVHGEAVAWPHGRGEAHFTDIRVTSMFPFGLIKRSVTMSQSQHTLIYPEVHELQPRVLDAISTTGSTGVRMSPISGSGDEYFGMREYRIGDAARQISWKRSAGRDALISVERTQPNPPRLRAVLDLTIPTAALPLSKAEGDTAGRRAEEQAISLTASLVQMAERQGYEVGLKVLGLDSPDIPLRRSQWHVHKIMASLASIDLDADRRSAATSDLAESERAGLVIVHPDRVHFVSREDAWHLTASQLASLSIRTREGAVRGVTAA